MIKLGNHRLLCADSTVEQNIKHVCGESVIDLAWTDPPYGDPRALHGGRFKSYKLLKNNNNSYVAIKSIELTQSIKNRIFWGANYYCSHLPMTRSWLVWDKNTNGNFGRCELAWTSFDVSIKIFKHTWNGFLKESEKKEVRFHPTQKPIALTEWCFENFKGKHENVLDLFGGSGSSLLACENTGRNCFMIEIDSEYCQVIIKRWEDLTNKKAIVISNQNEGNNESI